MTPGMLFRSFVFLVLICKITSTTVYNCTYESNNSDCVVKQVDSPKFIRPNLPRPEKCDLEFHVVEDCNIYGTVVFNYRGHNNYTGFLITKREGNHYFNITLPENFDKENGGQFRVNMKGILGSSRTMYVGFRYRIRVTAFPKSAHCDINKICELVDGCLKPKDFYKYNCNANIDMRDKMCKDVPTTTANEVILSTTSSSTERTSNFWLLVIGLPLSLVLVISVVVVVLIYKRWQKKHSKRRRAVILTSSGDNTSKLNDMANLIASELKSSGQYEDVFFNGWLQVSNLEENLEQLNDALHQSTVVILCVSPFGSTSYENFLKQGRLATWKDEFVIGAHSLFRSNMIRNKLTSSKKRKIFVVYHSEKELAESGFLHEDFERKADRCFDLSLVQDNVVLYKELLFRRDALSLSSNGRPSSNERDGSDESLTAELIQSFRTPVNTSDETV